jgi:hypothetical protein
MVVGMWADLWHSLGWFYPLLVLLICPPVFAIAGLVSGKMKANKPPRPR